MLDYAVIGIYVLALGFIFIFSLGQFHLTRLYQKRSKEGENGVAVVPPQSGKFPLVTIQLPVFNEYYVIERLIDKIISLEYPKEKLEIQLLDDSTDQTTELARNKVAFYQLQGFDIKLMRRPKRIGFKAGALQYGLESAKGDFIAVFDADFLPPANFLLKTLPHFKHDKIGMVQTKWAHINENYSLITRLQAFGLNAHFTVEQSGRQQAGSFINFNGTAGIWRKECILDAGGWSFDTLTEDLDLSYRAQLKGWRFEYLEEILSPAELPVIMTAVKSQQYRWNKGAAETARKNLKNVLNAQIPWPSKLHAFFHLSNSAVFVCLLIASLLSIPMLFIKANRPEIGIIFDLNSIFLIGFAAIAYFYWVSAKANYPQHTFQHYVINYPLFLIFSMGLSLHNSIAVLEGYFGYKTPFIRTPKFNIKKLGDSWAGNIYVNQRLSVVTILEAVLSIYFFYGIIVGFQLSDYGLILFHAMLFIGFMGIFLFSIFNRGHAIKKA